MKKRAKKYNSQVMFQKLSKLCSHRYKIAQIQSSEKEIIAIYDNKVVKSWFATEARMLTEVRYKWSCCVAALCRDGFGKTYIKSSEFSINIECLAREIDVIVDNQRDELMKAVNENQFLTFFWIASPIANYEFTEDELWLVVNASSAERELITKYELEKRRLSYV
ncbi:MAG: hypothetical protein [Bacteriophage sp.]|nr:MAG: hypothetical protein [Bacteriophage sp.]